MLYLLIAVVVLALLTKPKATAGAGAGLSPADQKTLEQVNAIARANFGVTGDGTSLVLADQTKYPGFYITKDGGYVSLDGNAFTPGTTPTVAYNDQGQYGTGAMTRPILDPTYRAPGIVQAPPEFPGYNIS